MNVRLFALIASLCLALAPAAAGDSDAAKQFKKGWQEDPNSWKRIELIRALNPSDKDSLELLTDFVLKRQDWYYRQAAIDVLAGAYDPGLISTLEKMGGGSRADPVIAEGIVMAFGKSGNADRIPFIAEQLKSKKDVVKRAAAIALGMIPDKRSIDPLITAWEGEDTFTVWIHMLETLEKITREKNLPTAADWRGWWDTVKDTWELPKQDEIEAADAKSGDVIRTRVSDTNLELRSRGKGMPLLVLPEYGYEKDYLETYLRNLEDTNQLLYASLPGVSDFPALPNAPNMPYPFYPIDKLVDAFEALHADLVKEKKIEDKPFAIMAHGLSCWIAMSYAANHPGRVRRMILIAPTSGGKAWGEGRDREEREGQQTGDIEMEHHAQSQVYENGAPRYSAKGPEEEEALQRKGHTLYFADTRDLEIGRIYGPVVEKRVGDGVFRGPACFRPMGSVTIPSDFSLFKLNRAATPTIVIYGVHSVRVSADDCEAICKHYNPAARVIPFKRSSRMPFIEENEDFVKTVRRFLGGR